MLTTKEEKDQIDARKWHGHWKLRIPSQAQDKCLPSQMKPYQDSGRGQANCRWHQCGTNIKCRVLLGIGVEREKGRE
jgi:hypothetical protein